MYIYVIRTLARSTPRVYVHAMCVQAGVCVCVCNNNGHRNCSHFKVRHCQADGDPHVCKHSYLWVHTHIYIYTYVYVYIYIHIHIHIYIYIYICIYLYIYIYIYTYAQVYICTHVYTHICIRTQTFVHLHITRICSSSPQRYTNTVRDHCQELVKFRNHFIKKESNQKITIIKT